MVITAVRRETRCFLLDITHYYIYMIEIQRYKGRRVKDGATHTGYAVRGTGDGGKTFILVPANKDSFHIMEVEAESLEAE